MANKGNDLFRIVVENLEKNVHSSWQNSIKKKDSKHVNNKILQFIQNTPKFRDITKDINLVVAHNIYYIDVIAVINYRDVIENPEKYKIVFGDKYICSFTMDIEEVKMEITNRWKICRLLWISHFTESESPLFKMRLPKEVLHKIINFLVYPKPKEKMIATKNENSTKKRKKN